MKKIGIGYEDYKRFIDDDMYYIGNPCRAIRKINEADKE